MLLEIFKGENYNIKKKKDSLTTILFPSFWLEHYITPIQDLTTLSTLKFRTETQLHLEATFINSQLLLVPEAA